MGLLEISYTSHSLVLLMFGGSSLCVVLFFFFFFYTGCGISSQQTSLKTFALYVKTKAGLRGLMLPLFSKCHGIKKMFAVVLPVRRMRHLHHVPAMSGIFITLLVVIGK